MALACPCLSPSPCSAHQEGLSGSHRHTAASPRSNRQPKPRAGGSAVRQPAINPSAGNHWGGRAGKCNGENWELSPSAGDGQSQDKQPGTGQGCTHNGRGESSRHREAGWARVRTPEKPGRHGEPREQGGEERAAIPPQRPGSLSWCFCPAPRLRTSCGQTLRPGSPLHPETGMSVAGNQSRAEGTPEQHRGRQGPSRYRIAFSLVPAPCPFPGPSAQICFPLGEIPTAKKYSLNSLEEMTTPCRELCSFGSLGDKRYDGFLALISAASRLAVGVLPWGEARGATAHGEDRRHVQAQRRLASASPEPGSQQRGTFPQTPGVCSLSMAAPCFTAAQVNAAREKIPHGAFRKRPCIGRRGAAWGPGTAPLVTDTHRGLHVPPRQAAHGRARLVLPTARKAPGTQPALPAPRGRGHVLY